MKVALVYDRVNKWGGAERVLLVLHELFPDAPLYTSVYNAEKAPWAKVFKIKPSFLQSVPFASSSHEFYPYLMPIAFESFSFDAYDLVISITSESAKGIITTAKTLHVCYCLTPTRYLWSGYETYFENQFLRLGLLPIISYLRKWDRVASVRPDSYIAISNEVKKRIKKYYQRDSEVVYPPVEIPNTTHNSKLTTQNKGYFLIVSRLIRYKKIDIAIKACNDLHIPLKIVGEGMDKRRLQEMASSNVEFLGSLTDAKLIEYYKGCLGLITPSEEDFGLSIVEAQKFGKPVIAFRKGGAKETVIDGKTGVFFDEQSTYSLAKAIEQFNNLAIRSEDCIENAQRFSKVRFKDEFMKYVHSKIRNPKYEIRSNTE